MSNGETQVSLLYRTPLANFSIAILFDLIPQSKEFILHNYGNIRSYIAYSYIASYITILQLCSLFIYAIILQLRIFRAAERA